MLPVLRELLPWLAILYLLDSLVWIRPGLRLFSSGLHGGWRGSGPGIRLVRWLPGARAYLASTDPVGFAPGRVFVFAPESGSGAPPSATYAADSYAVYLYESAARAQADGDRVRFPADGSEPPRRPIVRLPSPEAARELIETLRELAPLTPGARAETVRRRSDRRRDPEAVLRTLAHWDPLLTPIDISGTIVFLALFVLLPWIAFVLPGPPSDQRLAIIIGALAAINMMGIGLTYRRLRRAGRRLPAGSLSSALFYPPAAAHAVSAVGLHALDRFAALAVAVALSGDTQEVRGELRRELYGAEQAMRGGPDDPDWRALWARRYETADRLTRWLGIDPEVLKSVHEPHCPFCDGEFHDNIESCPDCEMPLLGSSTMKR